MTEDLLKLLEQAVSGDENAFSEIVERYQPLVQSVSARFAASLGNEENVLLSHQDFEQEALLALYRAVHTYERSQSAVSFGLYAKVCIRNALVSQMRKVRSKRRKQPATTDVNTRDVFVGAADRMVSDDALVLKEQIAEFLSPYEQRIFSMYVEGLSVKEIADSVGRSDKSVHNAIYRIRVKIRARLNGRAKIKKMSVSLP